MKHAFMILLASATAVCGQSNYILYAFTNFAGMPGGAGNVDGTGSAARFSYPTGLAVDSGGNLFVADTANHTIRKIALDAVVTTVAGTAWQPGSIDAIGSAARSSDPSGSNQRPAANRPGLVAAARGKTKPILPRPPDAVVRGAWVG